MRWDEETNTAHKCIHEALDLDWCDYPLDVRLYYNVKLPTSEDYINTSSDS